MSARTTSLWIAAIGAYFVAVVATILIDVDAWMSVAAIGALLVGLVIGQWKAAAASLAIVPALTLGVALGGEEGGDVGSGLLEGGLLILAFVIPVAIVICVGVTLRRGLSRVLGRLTAS